MEQGTYLSLVASRGAVYKTLSALYFPPDNGIDGLIAQLAEALTALAPEIGQLVTALSELTADLDTLLLDHSALFVGPFKLLAPPYGSIYLEGKREVMGPSTIDAWRRYELAGLDMAEEIRDAPDHIAIELEFMYYLIYRQCEALERGEPSAAEKWLANQTSFLEHHLGRWVESFAEKVRKNASTEHYRILATITASFVQLDAHTITTNVLDHPH